MTATIGRSRVFGQHFTSRLFTGNARAAAQLLVAQCTHPGCRVAAGLCDVDHLDEWHAGGRTEQRNADVQCRIHDRNKHRRRLTTRRDERGRVYTIRADGTIMLPVGEREPDLSADDLARITRSRLAALISTARSESGVTVDRRRTGGSDARPTTHHWSTTHHSAAEARSVALRLQREDGS